MLINVNLLAPPSIKSLATALGKSQKKINCQRVGNLNHQHRHHQHIIIINNHHHHYLLIIILPLVLLFLLHFLIFLLLPDSSSLLICDQLGIAICEALAIDAVLRQDLRGTALDVYSRYLQNRQSDRFLSCSKTLLFFTKSTAHVVTSASFEHTNTCNEFWLKLPSNSFRARA